MADAPHAQSLPASSAQADDVTAPPLSTINALARFEYESNASSQDATKVLMVEWMDTAETITPGTWHIHWEGQHSVLPAEDPAVEASPATSPRHVDGRSHRMFFLLGAATPIPPTVTLEHIPSIAAPPSSSLTAAPLTQNTVKWQTYPLPAIFPPQLISSAVEEGRKGVLHTLWAKKRLSVLSREISQEYRSNFEGIGLEMAIQERDWIIENFGVSIKPPSAPATGKRPTDLRIPITNSAELLSGPASPATPRSPGGGRLLEKMKGLRIGTSGIGAGIDTPPQSGPDTWKNPLSPEGSDVAASGFAAIKGFQSSRAAAAASTAGVTSHPPAATSKPSRMAAVAPPTEWVRQQQGIGAGLGTGIAMSSLGGMVEGDLPEHVEFNTAAPAGFEQADDDDEGDDGGLFQVSLSPRSPDMAKSPFSFAADDVAKSAALKEQSV